MHQIEAHARSKLTLSLSHFLRYELNQDNWDGERSICVEITGVESPMQGPKTRHGFRSVAAIEIVQIAGAWSDTSQSLSCVQSLRDGANLSMACYGCWLGLFRSIGGWCDGFAMGVMVWFCHGGYDGGDVLDRERPCWFFIYFFFLICSCARGWGRETKRKRERKK